MTAYATVADFQERTGQALGTQKAAQVAALLEEASALMRAAAADLDVRIADGSVENTIVVGVCVRAVFRYMANPDQASQRVTGPFSKAYAIANARGLWLTSEEVGALAPAAPSGTARGIGTVRVGLAYRPARGNARW